MSGSASMPSGYGTPPPSLPPNPGRATLRHTPGGIRLPWLASLGVLVLLGALIASLLHRGVQDDIPPSVLDARASIAHATAQAMRSGLDEASDDLAVLAAVLAVRPEDEWDRLLADFREVHRRYQVVYLLDGTGEAVHVAGEASTRAELLPRPLPSEPGLTQPQPADNLPALLAYAPVLRPDPDPLLLVGRYDVSFFVPALVQTAPGTAYLIAQDQRIVGSTAGFRAFQDLPDDALRVAADRAGADEPSGALLSDDSVVAFAPIVGDSPAGRLGLTVLSAVDRDDLALPGNDARRLAVLLGSLTALLAALSLFWMYLTVVAPVRRLAEQAERVAFGDRSEPVHVVRYDEIGLITRALERCRTLLHTTARKR